MLIGLNITKVEIPHEPGEWMLLREGLSPYHMQQCIASRQREALTLSAPIIADVGMDMFREIMQGRAEGRTTREIAKQLNAPEPLPQADGDPEVLQPDVEEAEPPVEPPDILHNPLLYDLDMGGNYLVHSWSYAAPVKIVNIQRLDAKTRDWLHGEVMARMPIRSVEEQEGNS